MENSTFYNFSIRGVLYFLKHYVLCMRDLNIDPLYKQVILFNWDNTNYVK